MKRLDRAVVVLGLLLLGFEPFDESFGGVGLALYGCTDLLQPAQHEQGSKADGNPISDVHDLTVPRCRRTDKPERPFSTG